MPPHSLADTALGMVRLLADLGLLVTKPYGKMPVTPAGSEIAATSASVNACSTSGNRVRMRPSSPTKAAPVGTTCVASAALAAVLLNSSSELNGDPEIVLALVLGMKVRLLSGAPV